MYLYISGKIPDQNMTLISHSNVELQCSSIEGGGHIEWTFNQNTYVGSSDYVSPVGTSLWLYNIRLDDQGDYSCLVNRQIMKTIYIQVIGMSTMLLFT